MSLSLHVTFLSKTYSFPATSFSELLESLCAKLPLSREESYSLYFHRGGSAFQEVTREQQFLYLLCRERKDLEMQVWTKKSKERSPLDKALEERELRLKAEEKAKREREEEKTRSLLVQKEARIKEEKKREAEEDEEEKTKVRSRKKKLEEDEEEDEEGTIAAQRKNKKKEKVETDAATDMLTLSSLSNGSTLTSSNFKCPVASLELIASSRVLLSDLRRQFRELSPSYLEYFSTRNQVVHLCQQGTAINYNDLASIRDYIAEKGFNYPEVETLQFLAKGGESYVLKGEIKQPVEVVMKMVLPGNLKEETLVGILNESHLINLMTDKEKVVRILEEIIEFSPDSSRILNYIVLVERASNDFNAILEAWASLPFPNTPLPRPPIDDLYQKEDPLCCQKMEFFTNEKLFLLAWKAVEALEYLHTQNVYYGDMKEANLLIFRDYEVKIGDFGIAIKMDAQEDPTENLYELKGITHGYCLQSFARALTEDCGELFSAHTLLTNDYFALLRTLQKVSQFCSSRFSYETVDFTYVEEHLTQFYQDSLFCQLMEKLERAHPVTYPLQKVMAEVKESVGNDFLRELLFQLVADEKFLAIPVAMKAFWKHSFVAERVQAYLVGKEQDNFPFLVPQEKMELHAEEAQKQGWKGKKVKRGEVVKQIRQYLANQATEWNEFLPVLSFYRGSLEPQLYDDFYLECFSGCFNLMLPSSTLSLSAFLSLPRHELDALFLIPQFQELCVNQSSLLTMTLFLAQNNRLKSQERTFQVIDYLLHKFTEVKAQPSLEDRLRILQILEIVLREKYLNNFKYGDIVEQGSSYLFAKNIYTLRQEHYCSHGALITYLDLNKQLKMFYFMLQKCNTRFILIKYKYHSSYAFLYEIFYENGEHDLEKKVRMKKKQKEVWVLSFGELGNQKSKIEYDLFKLQKELAGTDMAKYQESLYSLKKAMNYSLKGQGFLYLLDLLSEYQAHSNHGKAQQLIRNFASINSLASTILLSYSYPALVTEPPEKALMERHSDLEGLEEIFNESSLFREAAVRFFGVEEEQKEAKYDHLLQQWIRNFYIAQLKEYVKKNHASESKEIELSSDKIPNVCSVKARLEQGLLEGPFLITFEDRQIQGAFSKNLLEGKLLHSLGDSFEELHFSQNQPTPNYRLQLEKKKIEASAGAYILETLQGSYYGEVRHWTMHGQGKRVSKEHNFKLNQQMTIVEEGLWEKDRRKQVLLKKFLQGGTLMEESSFVNNLEQGEHKTYYDTGELQNVATAVKGLIEGEARNFYKSGNIQLITNFCEGQMHGTQWMYFEDGTLRSETPYSHGTMNGLIKSYNEKGLPLSVQEYKDGKPNGLCKNFHPNGQPQQEMNLVDGKICGIMKTFDQDGKLLYAMDMDKGQMLPLE